jgi:hypothetical protein
MPTLLTRFSFDASKMDSHIWAIVALVWLVMVGCGIGSVLSHGPRFDRKQRLLWITLIFGLPVIGLLIYLPFSVKREGFTLMRQTKPSKTIDGKEGGKSRMLKG